MSDEEERGDRLKSMSMALTVIAAVPAYARYQTNLALAEAIIKAAEDTIISLIVSYARDQQKVVIIDRRQSAIMTAKRGMKGYRHSEEDDWVLRVPEIGDRISWLRRIANKSGVTVVLLKDSQS